MLAIIQFTSTAEHVGGGVAVFCYIENGTMSNHEETNCRLSGMYMQT